MPPSSSPARENIAVKPLQNFYSGTDVFTWIKMIFLTVSRVTLCPRAQEQGNTFD